MTRRLVHRIGLVVIALLLAVGAYTFWYLGWGKYPFAGDLRHDFGEVTIVGQTTVSEHTFVLRNRRSVPLTILKAVPSCGCTAVDVQRTPVAPGEEIHLVAQLALSQAGHKGASISLVVDDGSGKTETQMIFVEGVGLKQQRFEAGVRQIALETGQSTAFTLQAEIQDNDDEPQVPTIGDVDGVVVTFKGWTLMRPRDLEQQRAARWRGAFNVVLEADELTANGVMIGVGENPPVFFRFVQKHTP